MLTSTLPGTTTTAPDGYPWKATPRTPFPSMAITPPKNLRSHCKKTRPSHTAPKYNNPFPLTPDRPSTTPASNVYNALSEVFSGMDAPSTTKFLFHSVPSVPNKCPTPKTLPLRSTNFLTMLTPTPTPESLIAPVTWSLPATPTPDYSMKLVPVAVTAPTYLSPKTIYHLLLTDPFSPLIRS